MTVGELRQLLFRLDDDLEVCVMGYEEGCETLTEKDVRVMDLVKGVNHEVRYAGEHYAVSELPFELLNLSKEEIERQMEKCVELCVVFCRSGRHVPR